MGTIDLKSRDTVSDPFSRDEKSHNLKVFHTLFRINCPRISHFCSLISWLNSPSKTSSFTPIKLKRHVMA